MSSSTAALPTRSCSRSCVVSGGLRRNGGATAGHVRQDTTRSARNAHTPSPLHTNPACHTHTAVARRVRDKQCAAQDRSRSTRRRAATWASSTRQGAAQPQALTYSTESKANVVLPQRTTLSLACSFSTRCPGADTDAATASLAASGCVRGRKRASTRIRQLVDSRASLSMVTGKGKRRVPRGVQQPAGHCVTAPHGARDRVVNRTPSFSLVPGPFQRTSPGPDGRMRVISECGTRFGTSHALPSAARAHSACALARHDCASQAVGNTSVAE